MLKRLRPNRRIESDGPSSASGGMIALIREPIDNQHQVLIVLELDFGGVELAALFDINLVMPVDQDIGDFIVPQKRFERSESEQLVFDFFYKVSLIGISEQPSLVVENRGDRLGDLLRRQHWLETFKPGDVQHLEQTVVDREFELLKSFGLRVFGGALGSSGAHQRTLKRRRRCSVLLRNSLNELHCCTSIARADNIQESRN
jgi:hypothetical protein